ncbi:hypothetical protein EGH22_09700 [Halomicroarcula sp. F28]|uniref:hypothetical protein n=1 Tax=Haloarcula salinisoli TaxID=2487746 RepID=UPI001C73462B|nr:hypothetical protein [Halomicroarcula salinisoli]MBX0286600.1 hypothetical protein [Halomicroarcula salinisoli]
MAVYWRPADFAEVGPFTTILDLSPNLSLVTFVRKLTMSVENVGKAILRLNGVAMSKVESFKSNVGQIGEKKRTMQFQPML